MGNAITKAGTLVRSAISRISVEAITGITWERAGEIVDSLKIMAVESLIGVGLDGPTKKGFVLQSVGEAFDVISRSIILPIYLEPFRTPIMWVARKVILALADGGIEAVYERLKAEAAE